MAEKMTHDAARRCPMCGMNRCLDYIDMPPVMRTWINDESSESVTEFVDAGSRNYKCRNCDAEFHLMKWS